MPCGCGGNSDSGGTLLSGSLDPRYATQPDQTQDASIVPGDFSGASFSSLGFWLIVIVVIGAAWYSDRAKKKSE